MRATSVLRVTYTAALLLGGGCSVITPPPIIARHSTAMPGPVGQVTLGAVGGDAAGLWVDEGAGGEGRVSVQVADAWTVGAAVGGGARLQPRDDVGRPRMLVAGRLLGRRQLQYWTNGRNSYASALDFGVGGGGLDTGLRYATLDVGALFGGIFSNVAAFYGGPYVTFSVPVVSGRPWDGGLLEEDLRLPTETFSCGSTQGLGLQLGSSVWLTAELTVGTAFSEGDGAFLLALTGGLTGSFGP